MKKYDATKNLDKCRCGKPVTHWTGLCSECRKAKGIKTGKYKFGGIEAGK